MRKTFDAELQELNYEMINMSAAAEDAIDVVTESLSSSDDAAAKAAIEMTRSMDQMERDIENRCLRLLLQQQPVARDLRTISAALKMVTDLQRIGDQCANIAEISLLLQQQKQDRTLLDIRTMSQKASVMVKRSIFAYVNRDDEAAREVRKSGVLVELTFKEFELLRLLCTRQGVALTRDEILQAVWDYDYTGETRTVDMHVKALRQKLGEDVITTVRGVGYKMS